MRTEPVPERRLRSIAPERADVAEFDRIEVGGLVVNDVPTFRIDQMPYGGVKQSGFGREGVRYAIEEMTELRLLALNDRG